MMKLLVLITLVCLTLLGCKDEKCLDELEGTWISITEVPGGIIKIDNCEMTMNSIWNDTNITQKISLIENNKMVYGNDTVGSPIIIDNNSFKIVDSIDGDIIFTKLNNIPKTEIFHDETFLYGSSWSYRINDNNYRIDLLNDHMFGDPEEPYRALVHSNDFSYGRNSEYWEIKQYDDHIILALSFHYTEVNLLFLNQINENSISATLYRYGEPYEILMQRIHNATEEHLDRIESILTSRIWNLQEYDTLPTSSSLFLRHNDSTDTLLSESILEKGLLSYEFKLTNELRILINGNLRAIRNWSLSPDGNFIWLNNSASEDCIEIQDISNNSLVINRIEPIMFSKKRRVPYFRFIQRLK